MMMTDVRRAVLAAAFLFFAAPAAADVRAADADMFPAEVPYDAAFPTPAEFLGFELGRHPVRHHQLVDYLRLLAERSDRLTVETIGHSHERRPILFLVATSPGNHARLDEIRARHVALSEPGSGQDVNADMPVVTWLNYGVHGAESSGMDAALPFAYHLAAAQGEDIERLLKESVVLVTAVFNPDGHAKRIAWFDSYGGERLIADPDHAEHDYDWQFARTNHYGFDLNRQWLLQTQPEPRAWMAKWHAWRPNLTVDYHEMGSGQTYYFHPGVRTRTNPLAPQRAEELMAATVATSEAFLDGEARLYYHGERFDNFYIGKGSTYPLVNGGVGVLYEAAAARGREIETDNGLRTYRENIRKHFRTSIASVAGAVALREAYLRYQKDFYDTALEEARDADTQAWVVSAGGDRARLHFFADLLQRHRIETHRLARDLEAQGRTFRAGESLLVPVRQPQYRLIRSVFETLTEFEDATFYDVSTWTLPPAFGLDHAPLGGRAFGDDLLGEPWTPGPPVAPEPPAAKVGYAFEWDAYYAPRALGRVTEAGLLARAALKPFSAATSEGTHAFGRGTVVVPFDRQEKDRETIRSIMRTIAAEDGVRVHALAASRSATGTRGIDLGSPSFEAMVQPRVLLVTGRGVDLYDSGEVWHLLDLRMKLPVTLRHLDRLGGVDWARYTHVILPGGDYDDDDAWVRSLRRWVRDGGTLVAIGDAASWAHRTTLARDEEDDDDPDSDEVRDEEEPDERLAYADKDDVEAVDVIGGAIFRGDLDTTHPLGFGFDDREIFLHKNEEEPLPPTDNPWGEVIRYTEDPLHSGYASEENVTTLAGTPALIAERWGAGSVILFADNPNFRGYWYGTNKLFMNTLFFGTAFERPDRD